MEWKSSSNKFMAFFLIYFLNTFSTISYYILKYEDSKKRKKYNHSWQIAEILPEKSEFFKISEIINSTSEKKRFYMIFLA